MTDEMNELERALRERLEQRETTEKQAEATKSEWLTALTDFFSTLDSWIAPLVAKGLINSQSVTQTLREEHLGEYQVPARVLSLAESKVEIRPAGRLIVGAIGRIDINARLKQIPILRFKEGWKIAEQHRRMIYHDFNERTFADILKQLM